MEKKKRIMQKSEKQFPERADSSMCNKTIYELKTNVQTPRKRKKYRL